MSLLDNELDPEEEMAKAELNADEEIPHQTTQQKPQNENAKACLGRVL